MGMKFEELEQRAIKDHGASVIVTSVMSCYNGYICFIGLVKNNKDHSRTLHATGLQELHDKTFEFIKSC